MCHYHLVILLCFLLIPPPPRSTLFPYTTLFRSSPRSLPSSSSSHTTTRRSLPDRAARPRRDRRTDRVPVRSEEHTSELQSLRHLVCRLLLEKKKKLNDKPCRDRTARIADANRHS